MGSGESSRAVARNTKATSRRIAILIRAWLAAPLLVWLAVAHAWSSASGTVDDGVESAPATLSALLHDRRFAVAERVLTEYLTKHPRDLEAWLLLADCRYRMVDYDSAAQALAEAQRHFPGDLRLREKGWVVRLAAAPGDKAVRAEVERDLTMLEVEYPGDPKVQLAVYRGYGYLDPYKGRGERLEQVLQLHGSPIPKSLELSLLGELIAARESGLQGRLAALYLREFPNGRGADRAAALLVRRLDPPAAGDGYEDGRLRGLLDAYPSSRSLRLQATAWLLRHGALDAAEGLVGEYETMLADAGDSSLPYLTDNGRRFASGTERAVFSELRGELHRARNELEQAAADYRSALDASPVPRPLPLIRLGESAARRGQAEEALGWFVRAVDAGARGLESEIEKLVPGASEGVTVRDVLAARAAVPVFDDVTAASGLGGVEGERIAWGDYDGDGDPDLLVEGHRLLANMAGERFAEVTAGAGLEGIRNGRGGIWGDLDNDGDLDLLVWTKGGNLLMTQEDGRFRDSTLERLDGGAGMLLGERTEAAAWGDLDGDGWLDSYMASYELPGPERAICGRDRLLHNLGKGYFREEATELGLVSDEPMCGRGVQWTDLDGDGRLDILVTNYRLDPNQLWINQGGGVFVDKARSWGVRGSNVQGAFGHTISAAVGDVDGDGRLDVFLSNLAHPRYIDFSDRSQLLLQSGPSGTRLEDRSAASSIPFDETNAQPALFDADNDGDLDLFVTSVYPGRRSHLYLNDGRGRFRDASWLSGTAVENGWAVAVADYDGDSNLDLAVGSADGVKLLRNRGIGNPALRVRVRSDSCNSHGVGALVRVDAGDSFWVRELHAGHGSGSQDELVAHFGLGAARGDLRITVRTSCGDEVQRIVSTGGEMRPAKSALMVVTP